MTNTKTIDVLQTDNVIKELAVSANGYLDGTNILDCH